MQPVPARADQQLHASDLDLVRAASRGCPRAVAQLLVRSHCIARILRARSHQLGLRLRREDFEDLQQDVLVVVFRKLSSYRGEASLESWLFGCCDLQLRNVRRRSRTRSRPLPPAPLQAERMTETDHELAEQRQRIRNALGELGAADRRLLVLNFVANLTLAEIAATSRQNLNTVKSRHARALQRLRQRLQAGSPPLRSW